MDELWISSIRDDRRVQKLFRLIVGDAGQKTMKPNGELAPGQDAPHQVGFHQRGRKEVFAARLPRSRIIHVVTKIGLTALGNQRFQFLVANCAGLIQREGQTKCRVRMHARADRIILFRQEREILFDETIRQRLKIL